MRSFQHFYNHTQDCHSSDS